MTSDHARGCAPPTDANAVGAARGPRRSRRPRRARALALPAAAALALLAGCGSDGGDGTAERAAPDAERFPAAGGETLEQLLSQADGQSELVASPAGQVFVEGENRFAFGVFELDRAAVSDADVAIYAARPGEEARGPFPARVESLAADAPYRSQTYAEDPDQPDVHYVAEIELDRPGTWDLAAIFDQDGTTSYALLPSVEAGGELAESVPAPGERPPRVDTPTAHDVGGDLTKIDTRVPASSMHEHNLSEVLGERPVVLLFATAALCQSRVCGPVIDIAEQVKDRHEGEAAFIHMEIYEGNDMENPVRPQVSAFGLPTEPWLFVIDESGLVVERFEGPFSAAELEGALAELEAGAPADQSASR